MKIASQEIRTLAIKAYDSGVPPQQIAETLGYHLNSINRWLRAYQTEGRVKALPRGHRISMFSAEERKQLVELLEKRPDMTLDEIRMHFGKQCSLNAVHKIVKALCFVFKKTLRSKLNCSKFSVVFEKQRLFSNLAYHRPGWFPAHLRANCQTKVDTKNTPSSFIFSTVVL